MSRAADFSPAARRNWVDRCVPTALACKRDQAKQLSRAAIFEHAPPIKSAASFARPTAAHLGEMAALNRRADHRSVASTAACS
jgi:hypothetical protein